MAIEPTSPLSGSGFGVISSADGHSSTTVDLAACLRPPSSPGCFSPARVHLTNATPATALTAPVGLRATANDGDVTLTWNAPLSGGTPAAYVIEAGSSPGAANLANFGTGNSSTWFSASGVAPGTYYIRVRAVDSGGASGPSNEVVLSITSVGCTGLPASPSGLTLVSNNLGTVVLSWGAAAGSPTSYVVEAGATPGAANLANSDVGPATSLTASAVAAGTYYVRVRAKSGCGVGPASNEIAIVVAGGAIPSVAGTWNLTAFPGPRPSAAYFYTKLTVTFVQNGSTLTGTLSTPALPGATAISRGSITSSGVVVFGNDNAWWWNEETTYFELTLDPSGTLMTGGCSTHNCLGAVAFRAAR
jgi:predicted phage tail protein